jgi:hypothetical protein
LSKINQSFRFLYPNIISLQKSGAILVKGQNRAELLLNSVFRILL